ncbi:MAG: hypothetical protein OXC80_10900 [Gammaproteobacteria bacterium]|nr:hypothetical protein [Gammaproteobacteria bacterium]
MNGIAEAALTGGDQRRRRVIERKDSESQEDGITLPQHGVNQECHLLPLWQFVVVH